MTALNLNVWKDYPYKHRSLIMNNVLQIHRISDYTIFITYTPEKF